MCRVLGIQRSGFYAWLKKPFSNRAIEDRRLLTQIKQFWSESGYVYGYRNITLDLKDNGETCGKNRVHRIMRSAGIRSHRGYKRHPGFSGGKASQVAPNTLDRQIIGWSMKRTPRSDLVLDALLMAVWRRKPTQRVLVHSDQGIQYTSSDWRRFLRDHNLEASMSRRGNCHDNAVAESFFSLLKTERIKRRIYKTREEARADIFDYIEGFYNRQRRHGNNGGLSPEQYENNYFEKLSTV